MGRITVGILSVMLGVACSPKPPYEPPPPSPGPADGEVEFCPAACNRWVSLDCADPEVCVRYDEPEPVCLESIPCADWCVEVLTQAPTGVVFNPKCVAEAEPASEPDDWCDWLDLECGGEQ